ncbi:MAG: LiaF domain-containing protein [Bacillota bacterium]
MDPRFKNNRGGIITGLVIVGCGVLIFGRNLGFYELNFSLVWKILLPLAIILIGFNMIKGALKTSAGTHFTLLSSVELKKKGWKLKSGSYFAVASGIDMDLTVAHIPKQEIHLNLTAFMGGIEIKVPRDLTIECQGTAILGSVGFLGEESRGIFAGKRYKHRRNTGSRKKLIIKGTAVMGNIIIKNSANLRLLVSHGKLIEDEKD